MVSPISHLFPIIQKSLGVFRTLSKLLLIMMSVCSMDVKYNSGMEIRQNADGFKSPSSTVGDLMNGWQLSFKVRALVIKVKYSLRHKMWWLVVMRPLFPHRLPSQSLLDLLVECSNGNQESQPASYTPDNFQILMESWLKLFENQV